MNKSLKKKWTKALRSDKYVQGRGQLVASGYYDEFCCLGVLCDVMGVEFEDGIPCLAVAGTLNKFTLPKSLLEKAELSDADQVTLTSFNDIACWNFHEIADWIDQNL